MAQDFYRGAGGVDIPIFDVDPQTGRGFDAVNPMGKASGLIPRDYCKYPLAMFAPPSSIVTIPVSEWDARYDEQEATESSLEHLFLRGGKPAFVNLDQNGDGDCADEKTEVLTDKGFVPWPDYNWTDLLATVNPMTHALEFQAPFEKHVKEYDGPLVYSSNKRVDFAVTPGHEMYVRKWDERRRTLSNDYSFVKAGELGWYSGLLAAPAGWVGTGLVELEIIGDRKYDGNDLIALVSLIVSDGYAGGSDATKNWVSFCCFREDRRAAVEELAHRVGFQESPSRRGVWCRYDAAALAEWVRKTCYTSGELRSHNKRVPALVKCASMRQIEHFLTWFGDKDHVQDREVYYSASKRLVDDLQELLLRVGRRGTICTRPPRVNDRNSTGKVFHGQGSYTVVVSKTERLCLERKKHIEQERYKGPVFCAGVPNHTLITRRNGTILCSSNCWAYSTGHSMMLQWLRDGVPPDQIPRLNPHFIATYLRMYNGGWCGASMEVARDVGCLTEGNGPEEWPKWSHNVALLNTTRIAAAGKYKVTELIYDLTRPEYSQTMNRLQVATCGFTNTPAPTDYNEIAHSVAQVRWVRTEPGSWWPLILNSWKGWGRFGLGVLRGMDADGAVATYAATPY